MKTTSPAKPPPFKTSGFVDFRAGFVVDPVPLSEIGHITFLAVQLLPSRSLTPCQRLSLACLEAGLEDLKRYKDAKNIRGRRLYKEAKEWLLNDSERWCMDFRSLCALFDFDPEAVRKAYLN